MTSDVDFGDVICQRPYRRQTSFSAHVRLEGDTRFSHGHACGLSPSIDVRAQASRA